MFFMQDASLQGLKPNSLSALYSPKRLGKKSVTSAKAIPQGLKPVLFSIVYGPAKAVP
jgi:hypothetical protein